MNRDNGQIETLTNIGAHIPNSVPYPAIQFMKYTYFQFVHTIFFLLYFVSFARAIVFERTST